MRFISKTVKAATKAAAAAETEFLISLGNSLHSRQKTSADPSELLENVYPAFITDEMLDGYDIEKVLHLPVFGMHLVYYVDDALAHKYDGLILSANFRSSH